MSIIGIDFTFIFIFLYLKCQVARPFPAQNQTNLTVGTPFPTGVAVYNAYTTSQVLRTALFGTKHLTSLLYMF